jgi:hypothetical protein
LPFKRDLMGFSLSLSLYFLVCYKRRALSKCLQNLYVCIYTGCPTRKDSILGGHTIGHSKQELHMYMRPIPNGLQHGATDVIAPIKKRQDALRRATRHVRVFKRVAKCIDIDGRIF